MPNSVKAETGKRMSEALTRALFCALSGGVGFTRIDESGVETYINRSDVLFLSDKGMMFANEARIRKQAFLALVRPLPAPPAKGTDR